MKTTNLLVAILIFMFLSCVNQEEKACGNFEDMYESLPVNPNLDTLKLKGKIGCNYELKYRLTNSNESADLIVTMVDGNMEYRLKEYKKTLPHLAKKNGIPLEELIYGIEYKTKNFIKGVRLVVKSSEAKEEHTSFLETSVYKAGFSQNRVDVLVKNRYYLSMYLHSEKKINNEDFKRFILPYLQKFDFKSLKF